MSARDDEGAGYEPTHYQGFSDTWSAEKRQAYADHLRVTMRPQWDAEARAETAPCCDLRAGVCVCGGRT